MTQADAPAATPPVRIDGFVDFFGYSSAAGGWFFCGWSADIWPSRGGRTRVVAHFERSSPVSEALICWYDRADLGTGRLGVVVFVPGLARLPGELIALDIQGEASDSMVRIIPVRPIEHLRELELTARTMSLTTSAFGDTDTRGKLFSLLSRRGFSGQDTIRDLPVPVHIEVDETLFAPPDGLVLIGWIVDPTQSVSAMRVRSGPLSSEPIGSRMLRMLRHDVVEAVGASVGVTNPYCGFLAFAPGCVSPGDVLYVEVELIDGSIGYKILPQPVKLGMAAMRRILEAVTLASDEFQFAFDRVLGPPIAALNKARLSAARPRSEIVYGKPTPNPKCSIIVPLYGRMDFLLYQMAFFSEYDHSAHEFIYVLDDPPRKQELLTLAQSVYSRFGVPFRVVCLQENLGFAPANNVGLEHARGEYVCFLNSDVMPDVNEWLDILVGDLEADPTVGVAGALLLFEDGTVQHAGMDFERLPDFANWPFPYHPNKGRLPQPSRELDIVEAVTGACMVLRLDLARELGGFDEVYAVGDFEDSDLCLKVRSRGLKCVVDARARCWHLERQSQAGSRHSWRMYLTLHNAWTHASRWFADSPSETEKTPQ